MGGTAKKWKGETRGGKASGGEIERYPLRHAEVGNRWEILFRSRDKESETTEECLGR